jgi:alkyl hydroperoxide reductase subunit AhpC
LGEFDRADTQVLGVSIDSNYCHGNWAKSLGGVTFPLLADFHPKGAMAQKYGVYLEDKGITDRATVIVDKNGVVRYAVSVTPAGKREAKDLLAEAQKVNKG